MDARVFNGLIILVRKYTIHTGGWAHPTASQHNIFDSGKTLTNFSCAPDADGGSNLGSLDLESDALTTEPPRHPHSTEVRLSLCNNNMNENLEILKVQVIDPLREREGWGGLSGVPGENPGQPVRKSVPHNY